MKILDLYVDAAVNAITGGEYIKRSRISSLGLRVVYDRFVTKKFETKVWCILGIPTEYENNITQGIRQQMFVEFPKVRTMIHTYNVPSSLKVEDRAFIRRYKLANEEYKTYAELFENLEPEEKVLGKQLRNANGRRIYIRPEKLQEKVNKLKAYNCVQSSVAKGDSMSNCFYFVQASCEDIRMLRRFDRRLRALCRDDGIALVDLRGNLTKYLANYGPTSYHLDAVKNVEPMLFTEENHVALLPTRTKGLVGDHGILFGQDRETKLPFLIDLAESAAAQVILLLGMAGSGKTYNAFNICMQLAGIGTHSAALDFKGNEWNKLLRYLSGTIVDMDGSNARFVNTLRIDDMAGRGLKPVEVYNSAVNGTVMLLSIMTNLTTNEGNVTDLLSILSKAVAKVFSQAGVIANNESTFSNSKKLTYADVINTVSELAKTAKSYTEKQIELCTLVRTRCETYFMGDGQFNEAFKNEITVGEILDKELVIYSFNKNTDGTLSLLDTIRVFMTAFLNGKKQTIRKALGLQTAAFYEELQRCENMAELVRYISGEVTGSRSSNVTIFLLLNAISTLKQEAFAQIKSNITTKIVGKVTTDDIETLAEKFDCASIKDKLQIISENTDGSWRNCFAIDYDTGKNAGTGVYKTILPKEMEEAFRTREHH